ncbi:hypothetical protein BDR07DRAFT_1378578 [Suillus spraguei]|nr:hypothetical protein BDR07DRAFT_1378578 [Suillus spraguei]
MPSESRLRTVHTEETAFQDDKVRPETLEACQITKDWDPPSDPQEFPEGGLVGWITAFGSFLVQFCGFGYTASFGVYQDFYAQHYLTNETSSAISWIGSTNAFLQVTIFSLFMLSLSKPDQYYQIYLSQGIGLGVASGLMYIPSVAVISHHFRRRRTLVMTFVATGASLGAIIHPIMLNNLFNGPLGLPMGSVQAQVNYIVAARKCICDVPFVLTIAGCFLFQVGFFYPLFFFQLDSIKHGRLTSGFIAAFTGVPNLVIIATFSCGVIILGMIGLSNLASVVVLCVVYGYFSGLYNGISVPLLALLTPDLSELGIRKLDRNTHIRHSAII